MAGIGGRGVGCLGVVEDGVVGRLLKHPAMSRGDAFLRDRRRDMPVLRALAASGGSDSPVGAQSHGGGVDAVSVRILLELPEPGCSTIRRQLLVHLDAGQGAGDGLASPMRPGPAPDAGPLSTRRDRDPAGADDTWPDPAGPI